MMKFFFAPEDREGQGKDGGVLIVCDTLFMPNWVVAR